MKLPKEGSHVRKIYDQLFTNKGIWLELENPYPNYYSLRAAVAQLRDFYELDIESRPRPSHATRGRARSDYMLKGRYINNDYVSYMKKEEKVRDRRSCYSGQDR